MRRLDAPGLVAAARKRAGEDVVHIGRDDKPLDGQPHALGVVARENIAKISGRNSKGDPSLGSAEGDGADEIIDNLGEDARPIDRVHARKPHLVAKGEIAEQLFDDALAVIKRALDRQRVDVCLADRRHLPALHIGDAAPRIKNIDVGLRLPAERLDRSSARVAGGRAENGRAYAARTQDAVHGAAEPLHGEILERQCRPMKKLEREQVVVDLNERSGGSVPEAAICVRSHQREFCRAEFACR